MLWPFQGIVTLLDAAAFVYLNIRMFSISGEASRREDVKKMGVWLEGELNKYGVKTESIPLGTQKIEGQTLDLPPAILGRIGDDPNKKTILIYGHFDVQPVRAS
jgi:Cys-Gly metallodipeptidase DUG1